MLDRARVLGLNSGMPTNILRHRPAPGTPHGPRREHAPRRVLIKAGQVALRAELAETPTADRIWAALPIFSTAEIWGQSLHFETPVETGRDRTARELATIGDIFFWVENDRILIAFGPTPISRPGEIRLPRPCNVWARALGDVTPLKDVAAGEKVSVTAD